MLIGFNNDVEYRGKTFHIQTEDHGEGDPRIETQLFFSGAILDTNITSYQETLDNYDGKQAEERIRAQMKASHRSLYKKLLAGEYDEIAGLEPVEDVEEVGAPDPDEFTPSQERIPAAAAQVEEKAEEEGDDAILEFTKKKAKEHVDLNTLKDQLDGMGDGEDEQEAEDVEEDVAPTQVIDPSDGGLDFSSVSDDADDEAADEAPPAAAASASAASEAAASAKPPANRQPRRALVEFEKTGATAWNGCGPAKDPLSLTELVEDFLGL